jgi:hypothetical protein
VPRDKLFSELASRWPDAVLALLGRDGGGRYRGRGEVVVEAGEERRIDLVLRPERPSADLPTALVETQRRVDPLCERILLRKVLAEQTRALPARRTVAAVLYASHEVRERALPADVPSDGPLDAVTFRVERHVLPEIDPAGLERRGGAALVVLPIVGRPEVARASADRWLKLLRETATLGDEVRDEAVSMFLRLMADRFPEDSLPALFPKGWRHVKHTAMARDLIEIGKREGRRQGVRQGVRRGVHEGQVELLGAQLREVLGPVPELEAALLETDSATLVEVGRLLVGELSAADKRARITALLLPPPRAARPGRRARSGSGARKPRGR